MPYAKKLKGYFNTMKFFVPNQMNEIKLVDYQKFIRLEGDDEFLARKSLEIFCGLKMDVILQMKASSLTKVNSILMKAFNERPALKQRFFIGKQEFGFIPSLEEITVGELNDVDQYISDWSQMHKAMAVLFRPVISTFGQRYDIEKYEGSAKYAGKMLDMPLDIAIGAMFFFWTLGSDLSKASQQSLAMQNQMNLAQLPNFPNDGIGSLSSTNSQEETL
jgi:hypothetical protein